MDCDVVILAAGRGTRLAPITDSVPKCLVPVCKRPILGWLLHAIQLFNPRQKALIVGGYRVDRIAEYLKPTSFLTELIVNSEFEKTNNMYSFSLCFEKLNPETPLILMNGDCVYEPSILTDFMKLKGSHIATDSQFYSEESMKVREVGGSLREISKALKPGTGVSASIDMYRFEPSEKAALLEIVRAYLSQNGRSAWTEVAIDLLLKKSEYQIRPWNIDNRDWVEIDNSTDLSEAENSFSKFP